MNHRPHRKNPLERYRDYMEALELPRYDSLEDAEQSMTLSEGEEVRFLLVRAQGSYTICCAYMAQSRNNPPKWVHREEYSFIHGDVWKVKREAALAIGMELIESMER